MSNKPLPSSIVSIYANLLPRICKAARPLGWAIGVHGSLVNDMDLMAMPWVDDAASEEDLVAAIVEACKPSVPFLTAEATTWMSLPTPKDMPHGRRSWSIHYGGTVYIDLCVMPRKDMSGAELIANERRRQSVSEGWSVMHDDSHTDESLARAAACYAMPERFRASRRRGLWAWASKWWKPTPDDRIKELVKAGALIAAEIDRLQRRQGAQQ